MDLEAIYYIGQTVSVVAIILSLIFVGVQIRQSTAQAKADAADTAHRTFNDWYLNLTPEMAALFIRAIRDFDSYKPEEKYLIYAYMMPMFVNLQEVHSKWLNGSFPEDRWKFWDSWLSQAISPLLTRIWEERRDMFSESYRAYVDKKIAVQGDTPTKGSVWALFDEGGEDVGGLPDLENLSDEEPGA